MTELLIKKIWYKTWPLYSFIAAIAIGVLILIVLPGYDWRLYLLCGLVGGVIVLSFNPNLRYLRIVYIILSIIGAFQVVDFYILASTEKGSILIKSPKLGTAVSLGLILLAGLALTYDLLSRKPRLKGPDEVEANTNIKEQTNIENQEVTNIETVKGDIVHGPKTVNNFEVTQPEKVQANLTPLPRINCKEDLIGRKSEMETLSKKLKAKSTNKILLLNGMGGIGKTTLAMAYVQTYRSDYQHVAWVSQLNPSGLFAAFADNKYLKSSLKLQFTDEKPKEQFGIICLKLRALEGQNLLVIDNADASAEIHEQELPDGNWKTLVTSRNEIPRFDAIMIGSLLPENAKELFLSHCNLRVEESDLDELLKEVEYHTLTVELMAKTIESQHGSLSIGKLLNYLRERQMNEETLQSKVSVQHREHFRGKKKVKLYSHLLNTFSFQNLDKYLIDLLKQYAVLPSEPQPTLRMKEWLKVSDDNAKDFDEGIKELISSGWLRQVESDDFGHAAVLHRMIREVILLGHPPEFNEIENLVQSVTDLIHIDQTKDNPVDKFPWAVYGQSLLDNLPAPPPPENNLRNELALLYRNLGRYEDAAKLLESALESALSHFGELHPNVAVSRSNLAIVYQALGRYEDAAKLLESALESDLSHFGELHPNVARNRSNLALVYKDLGRYEDAANLLESALESDLSHFGELHPTVAGRRSNLAIVYQALGRYEDAAKLLESALESDLSHFGELHPNVALSRSNLALVYKDLGRYEDAAKLLESALESDLSHFGELHPNVALSRSNLALVYQALGRYEDAAKLLESALESDLSHFGDLHPNVARSRSNLALVYKDLGRYEDAAKLLESALESALSHFGELHPNVAVSRSNLATVYQALGRYEDAANLLESALDSVLSHFGELHPTVAGRRSKLALVYSDLGRYEDAAKLLESALESDLSHFGELHPNVVVSRSNLATVYKDLGRLPEGKELAGLAYESLERTLGPEHPNTKFVKRILESFDN
jgi:tetratricopeptide (TPR) repeat protein